MKSRISNTAHLGRAALSAALSLTLFVLPVGAQERPEGFSVGVAVAAGNGIYVGEDESVIVLPTVRYDSEVFSVGFPDGARLTVFSRDDFRVSAIVAPRLSGIDTSDSDDLDDFDREITADGGFQLRYTFAKRTQFILRAVTELTDEHDGSEVGLSVSHAFPIAGFPLRLGAGLKWQSEELALYEYGVSAADAAASTFAEYDPGDVIIPHVSIGTAVPVYDRARILASVRAEFLPDEISDSPIVDEDVSVRAFIGLSYNF